MDNLKSATWFLNISANEFELESNKERQLDKEESDFEFKSKVAVFLQPVTKKICQNKERKNKLKNIHRRGSVLLARKKKLAIKKLAIKKLEKKAFKTNNIKTLQQCNCNLGFNFKVNTLAFKLAKSSESVLSKKTNFAYLLFNVT